MDMICNIAEDLLPLAYPIEKLRLLPGNPNKGDVEALVGSISKFKQRKPIVAKHDGPDGEGVVLAGNTTLKAAREAQWTHVAVSWADDLDETHAAGFTLADNEIGKHGETDEAALEAMQEIARQDDDVWDATGFRDTLVEDFLTDFDTPFVPLGETPTPVLDEDDDEPYEPQPRAEGKPVIQYTIVFDDVEQQQTWFRLQRWLKRSEEFDAETIAGRLIQFVEPLIMDGE